MALPTALPSQPWRNHRGTAEGCKLQTASDGGHDLDQATAGKPDFIVCDFMTPDTDDYELS